MSNAVTGGVVSIEDGKKAPEEYTPARKVRVELHFEVPEGSEAQPVLDIVSNIASRKVSDLLAVSRAPDVTDKDRLAIAAGVQKPASETSAATQHRTRKPKDAPAAAAPAASPAAAPAQGDLEDVMGQQPAAAPTSASDSLDDVLGIEAPAAPPPPPPTEKPITDTDLTDAIQKKNGTLKNPPKIRELVNSYNPQPGTPWQARNIPAERRKDFLEKLAALA